MPISTRRQYLLHTFSLLYSTRHIKPNHFVQIIICSNNGNLPVFQDVQKYIHRNQLEFEMVCYSKFYEYLLQCAPSKISYFRIYSELPILNC